MLCTVMEYTPFVPTVKLPVCDVLMVRSGAVMVVGSFEELLAALLSLGVATLAVLVTGELASAVALTVTVRVMVLALGAPMLIGPGFVQVTTCPAALQVQLVPAPLTNPSPAGSVSVTVIAPVVAAVPMLVTVIV